MYMIVAVGATLKVGYSKEESLQIKKGAKASESKYTLLDSDVLRRTWDGVPLSRQTGRYLLRAGYLYDLRIVFCPFAPPPRVFGLALHGVR